MFFFCLFCCCFTLWNTYFLLKRYIGLSQGAQIGIPYFLFSLIYLYFILFCFVAVYDCRDYFVGFFFSTIYKKKITLTLTCHFLFSALSEMFANYSTIFCVSSIPVVQFWGLPSESVTWCCGAARSWYGLRHIPSEGLPLRFLPDDDGVKMYKRKDVEQNRQRK